MSSIRIQYTTALPFTGLTVAAMASVSLANGVYWSAFAAFSKVAILLGKNLTSVCVRFAGCALVFSGLPSRPAVGASILTSGGVMLRARLLIARADVLSMQLEGNKGMADAFSTSERFMYAGSETVEVNDVDVDALLSAAGA